jgi:branched-chain amino acid transport system substrate-binding protein
MRKIASVITLLLLLVLSLMLGSTISLAQTEAQSDIVCENDVIVEPYQTLIQISINVYGDHRRYGEIIEATNLKAQSDNSYPTISNEHFIKPGWKLCVPSEITVTPPPLSTPSSTTLNGVIKIGAAQALSGPSDAYGNAIRDGIELAVEQVNDSGDLGEATLEVIWEDTKGIPLLAIRAFNKLINEDEVVAIIGPTLSNSAIVADWLAQQEGVPVVSSSNTALGVTDIGSYIFRTARPDSAIIPNTIREAKNQWGLKRVAVIYDKDDAFTKSSYDLFTEALAQEKLTVVMTEIFATGETDFSEQLTKIRDENPDAIVISALVTEGAEILKQARELGIPESVRFIGGDGFNTPQLFELAGEAANGLISGTAWYADNRLSNNERFIADFKKTYRRDPDQFAAQAYTAVWALATAIGDANSIDQLAVRDALDEMGIIDSPLGPFTFDDNRDAIHASAVQVVDNGEFTLLATTPSPPNPDNVIKIGAAYDLSGPTAKHFPPTKNSINLAIKEINESGLLDEVVQPIWEDTGGTPQQATQALYKLINDDQVVAILGPTRSNSAFAADLLAQEAGVPVIATSNLAPGITDIGDYIFRTSSPENVVIHNTIKVSKELLGLQRVALIYSKDDRFARLSQKIFVNALETEGVEIVITESFKTGDAEFYSQLTKIKNKNKNKTTEIDAIIISALPEDGIKIMQQARELDIPSTVRFIGGGSFNTTRLIEEAGKAADGLITGTSWYTESDEPDSKKFVAAYENEYGLDPAPDQFAAQAYTALWALAKAMSKANDPTDRTAVRDALDNLGVIRSPLGLFRFDEKGDPVHDQVVQVARDKKWVDLETFVAELPSDLPSVIKVGAAHALSGPANPSGNPSRNGINLAVKQINENKRLGTTVDDEAVVLEVIWEDTAGDKDQASEVFDKLINDDQVVTILGPTLSNSAFEADPVAQEAGVPVIASSNTATGITEIGEYIFRTSLPESALIPNTIKEIKASLGVQTVAVMYDEVDAFTKSGDEVFEQVLREEGLEIVTTETFQTGETDFSAQLTKIKELNPDAIVVSALAAEAILILQQARELGIPENVRFIGGNGFNTPDLFNAGEAANGAISGAAWNIYETNPASEKFVEAYQAEYGSDPDQFAAQAYTAVFVLAEAIRNAESADRARIRDALAALDETNKIDSPLGLFSFDENRDPVHSPVVQTIVNGEFVLFK